MITQELTSHVPSWLLQLVPILAQPGVVIAGSAAAQVVTQDFNYKPNDIDIFLCDPRTNWYHMHAAFRDLGWYRAPGNDPRRFHFAHKGGVYPDIDLIPHNQLISSVDGVESLLDTFDFTVAQAAITGTDVIYIHYTKEFEFDFAMERLVVHKPQSLISTLRRVSMYGAKGFKLSKIEATKLLLLFSELPICDVELLEEIVAVYPELFDHPHLEQAWQRLAWGAPSGGDSI